MKKVAVKKRSSRTDWIVLFKRFLCAYIFKGHKFERELESWEELRYSKKSGFFFVEKKPNYMTFSNGVGIPFLKFRKKYREVFGKRRDKTCLRCGAIFYTVKNYKRGKRR